MHRCLVTDKPNKRIAIQDIFHATLGIICPGITGSSIRLELYGADDEDDVILPSWGASFNEQLML